MRIKNYGYYTNLAGISKPVFVRISSEKNKAISYFEYHKIDINRMVLR